MGKQRASNKNKTKQKTKNTWCVYQCAGQRIDKHTMVLIT